MRVLLLSTVLAVVASIAPVAAQARVEHYQLNIPRQPLDAALKDFAQQTGLQIARFADVVDDTAIVGPLAGQLSATQALDALLTPSGLTYRVINERTIAIGKLRTTAVEESGGTQEPAATTVEEIVVTAQKRIERLQDVPVPVTAVSADTLIASNQLRLQDFYTRIPGLSLTPSSRGGPMLAIRGVTAGNATGPTVGIVVDDLPYGPSTGIAGGEQAPDIDPGDLARLEVLRGPQGTLYGASNIGGLVNYVTASPSTRELSGRVQAGLSSVENGNEAGYNVRGSVNIPLSETWAIRASGFKRREPGYIDNVQTGEDALNQIDASGGRLSALWQPSETVSLRLGALIQDLTADGSSDVVPQPGLDELQNSFLRGTGGYDKRFEVYSANLNAKLNSIDVTAVSGYSINQWSSSTDFTGVYGPTAQALFDVSGAALTEDNETRKFTQEIRASAPMGDSFEWLLGGFYTDEDTSFEQQVSAVNPATGAFAGQAVFVTFPTTFKEYALFADLTWKVTERFDIQVGGRRSQDKQTYILSGAFGGSSQPSVLQPKLDSKENATTYLLTPRLRITPDLMVYARLASGYRAGGPNTIPSPGVPTEYDPDKTRNYELGIKADVLDHRLALDASVYSIDWDDIQLNLVQGGIGYYDNAGGAKSRGVELSMESRPVQGLTIAAWAAWNDAELTDALPAGSSVAARSGDRLPFSSRFSGSVSLDGEFPVAGSLTGFAGSTVSYVDDRQGIFTAAAQPRQTFPRYTKWDLRAGLKRDEWAASIFVNNVTDERGILGSNPAIAGAIEYIQPRVLGLTLSRSF